MHLRLVGWIMVQIPCLVYYKLLQWAVDEFLSLDWTAVNVFPSGDAGTFLTSVSNDADVLNLPTGRNSISLWQ